MEYLMTYGWAILIISIVLAGLFSLGVFSISNTSSNACAGTVGFLCGSPQLVSNGLLSVTIGQLGKGTLSVTGLGCSNTTSMPSTLTPVSFSFQPTQSLSLSFSCNLPSSTVGSGFSGTLWMQYSQGSQTGMMAQVATIKTRVTQLGAVSGGPTLYTVTFDVDGTYATSIVANGVSMINGATGSYPYGDTIPINAIITTGYFSSWTATSNLVVNGGAGANPTTLTINGAGTLTATGYTTHTCFAWGTPTMTLNGTEPIQDLKNGTIMYSFNAISNSIVLTKVIKPSISFDYYMYNITTALGSLTVPADQPFYVGNNTFVSAEKLVAGDEVGMYQNSTVVLTKILSINVSYAPQLTYDVDLNNTHNFFAGGFVVHNCASP
jgi:hypothetical protein